MTDDRDQRIDALRGLAQEGAQPNILPSRDIGAQPAAPRRSRKALLLAVISALVVVAVAGGLIARRPPIRADKAAAGQRHAGIRPKV